MRRGLVLEDRGLEDLGAAVTLDDDRSHGELLSCGWACPPGRQIQYRAVDSSNRSAT